MTKIQVLGEGCDKCYQLYENTVAAVEMLGLNVQVEKVEDLLEIVQLGVMSAPSLLVDGKLLVSGRVASVKTIADLLRKHS